MFSSKDPFDFGDRSPDLLLGCDPPGRSFRIQPLPKGKNQKRKPKNG
jgi:hypothetical protein